MKFHMLIEGSERERKTSLVFLLLRCIRGVFKYECNWVNFQKRVINNAKLFISNPSKYSPPCDTQSFSLLIQFLNKFHNIFGVYCSDTEK